MNRLRREPIWIEERELLAIHARLLGLHGGAPGIRDLGLLQSALARPLQHYSYSKSADIVDLSALYTIAIVRNHPFLDGNKRTGFLAGILFLELNGFEFTASEEDAAQAVMSLAASTLDGDGFKAWIRRNCKPQNR